MSIGNMERTKTSTQSSHKQNFEKRKERITLFILALIAASLSHIRFLSDSGILNNELVPFWAKGLFYVNAFISYFLLLSLALKSRLAAYFLLPICITLQILGYYIATHYGTSMTSELVTAALETNWQEISGFLYPSHYILMPMAILLLLGGIYLMRSKLSCFPRLAVWKAWTATGLYIILSSTALAAGVYYFPNTTSHLVAGEADNISPDSSFYRSTVVERMQDEASPEYIYRAYLPFYRQISALYNIFLYYKAPSFECAAENPSHDLFADRELTVVFIIGESFRSDHSPWNGYHRNTLPQLTKAATSNSINFPWFKSFGTTTITSIYGMLSDATCTGRHATHTSFLGILKKHGFDNRLLVSRTSIWYKNPQIYALIRDQFDEVVTSHNNDDIVRNFTRTLKSGKQCIVLEDGTGHYPYYHEERFQTFDESDPNNRINKYDNCLVQTDDLLSRFVAALKDRNAVLVYSSDHGQSFGEQGFWMHGGLLTAEKQRHVFSFVWCSDTYRQRHPEIVSNMLANKCKPLSHDYLYHSILSLSGIESAVQDPHLDFTKPLECPDASSFSLGDESHSAQKSAHLQSVAR